MNYALRYSDPKSFTPEAMGEIAGHIVGQLFDGRQMLPVRYRTFVGVQTISESVFQRQPDSETVVVPTFSFVDLPKHEGCRHGGG